LCLLLEKYKKSKMAPKKRKSSSKGDSNLRPIKIPKGKRSSASGHALPLTPLLFEYHEGYPRPPPKDWIECDLDGIPQKVHTLHYWEGQRNLRLDAVFQTLSEGFGLTVKELHALIGTYIDAAIILMCRAERSWMFTILEHFDWESFARIVSDMDLHVIPDMQFDEYRFECTCPDNVIRHGWYRESLFHGIMPRDPPRDEKVTLPIPSSNGADGQRSPSPVILPLSARALRFWIPDPFEVPIPTDDEKIALIHVVLTRTVWDVSNKDNQEIKDSTRSFIDREGHWPTALFVEALCVERLDILNYLMDLNDSVLKSPIFSHKPQTQLWGLWVEPYLDSFTTNSTLINTVQARLSLQIRTLRQQLL